MKKITLKRIQVHFARKNLIKMSDEEYIKYQYKDIFGKELDLENPKTFNEKLQWLKLNDRKKIYTIMADKYEAKKYVSNVIGKEYIIPTLGIYNKVEDIEFEKMPNKFVLKCTHDSGSTIVCKDKEKFDFKKSKKNLKKNLKNNFFYIAREWPYKNIVPRIIVEQYLENTLTDYRFYCFNGKVKYIYMYISKDMGIEKPEPEKCNIYNEKWELQDFKQKSNPTDEKYEKPKELEKMIELSEKLSENTKFLRVDFYLSKNKIYFSEMTFFPGGGFSKFYPESADLKLGEKLKI